MLKHVLFLSAFLVTGSAPAQALIIVPEGNRNDLQPDVPFGSAKRTRALQTTYDRKYEKVIALLREDYALREKIRKVAQDYDIDPVHIAGAIIGEHTYNVDVYDRLQTYYVKAISYVTSDLTFAYNGENITEFVKRPQFGECSGKSGSYDVWVCRDEVWKKAFAGQTVDGVTYPDDRFSAVFFQPYYAGQTFGIGQLNPLTALEMSDLVHETSNLPKLDAGSPQAVYKTIMDPDLTLPYVAATIRKAIDSYSEIAGFDISGNPGITATLYNLGNPKARAQMLYEENRERVLRGEEPRLPEENYYGWLVNDQIGVLTELFADPLAQQN